MTTTNYIVLKFGGTSVKTRERWNTIAEVVRKRRDAGETPLVVCSALSQITNTLERLLTLVTQGAHLDCLNDIKERHRDLALDLDLSPTVVEPLLNSLEQLALGASLVREVSPRLRAKVLSHGELLSTTLGAAFLSKENLNAAFVDARDLLKAERQEGISDARQVLNAACRCEYSEDARAYFDSETQKGRDVFITQGFIASDEAGDTVLLGRGGSDTSAAYLASLMGAKRCEIWTDVPGVFSANPKATQSARLLRRLDYDEAQEIASTGAKVLHPRSISPCRNANIPMHIYCTPHPEIAGTQIAQGLGDTDARVKAISEKNGVCLLSMDTLGMWQQVGFLSDVFACFKKHGVSIDVVSTSESNVTVTLDRAGTGLDESTLKALVVELNTMCSTRVVEPCTAISLVGKRIRAILHQLGPVLKVFEEQKVHLVSQAASDLNLTFVVDEKDAPRIVQRLHALLFDSAQEDDPMLGPVWSDLFEQKKSATTNARTLWWMQKQNDLLKIKSEGPCYVYDRATISERASSLAALKNVERVFYAIKANANDEVLRTVYDAGLGFECVSIFEVNHVRSLFSDIEEKRILFTPNFAPREEYAAALELGVNLTVDNLHPLSKWPELFRGHDIFLRLDPGKGRGHHKHVRTAGKQSKFGISPEKIGEAKTLVEACGARVVGLHAHAGSGIRDASSWQETAAFLIEAASGFEHVKSLDLGGGLGVVERKNQSALDLNALDEALGAVKSAHPQYDLWLEPGRFVVAEAGVILGTVTQTKEKGDVKYVGTDIGMHTLIRPALYGAFHEIVNLSRIEDAAKMRANIVGPICETGDTLGSARYLPHNTVEGDRILVAVCGAYGRVMASSYNQREPGPEFVI